MPEYLKALVVVMGIALPVLILARQPLSAAGYDEALFKRHRLLWISITLIAFLSHNFWLCMVLCAYVLFIAGLRDKAPLALYLAVLFAVPHFEMLLPGIGPIQNLFYVSYIRVLNLALLLPLAMQISRSNKPATSGYRAPDGAVLGYLLILLVMQAVNNESITETLRNTFYLLIDIALPYYVASRAITGLEQFRQVAGALLLATVIMALIGVFESAKGWLLYESLRNLLGIPLEFTNFMTRSEGGPLRAVVSTTHPIILGYVLMTGLGMFNYLAPEIRPRWQRRVAAICLGAGLIAAFSRGPWVGAAVMALSMIVMGPAKSKRLLITIGIGGTLLLGLLASPWGETIVAYLPFVGSVAKENVVYRQHLFDVAMLVFWQNPMLGDPEFMNNPLLEQMRQGQGIIDIVNSYLQVALRYGLLGLSLFLAAMLLPMLAVWRARKRVFTTQPEAERLGRALLATMAGILVTIATASDMGAIPTLCWIVAGLCVAYARMLNQATKPAGRFDQRFTNRNAAFNRGLPGRTLPVNN